VAASPTRPEQTIALDATLASVLSMHARYADLIVLGQVNPDEPPYAAHHVLEEVVLSSGRPALIVPYDCAPDTFPERVLIAWDASREGGVRGERRNADPQQATSVLVVSINPRSEPFATASCRVPTSPGISPATTSRSRCSPREGRG
jgi:hypothetical protein